MQNLGGDKKEYYGIFQSGLYLFSVADQLLNSFVYSLNVEECGKYNDPSTLAPCLALGNSAVTLWSE